jgi:hypothetical protein
MLEALQDIETGKARAIGLGMASQAPEWAVRIMAVAEPEQSPTALARTTGRFATSCATLAGTVARPVASRALCTLVPEALNHVRGLLRRTR